MPAPDVKENLGTTQAYNPISHANNSKHTQCLKYDTGSIGHTCHIVVVMHHSVNLMKSSLKLMKYINIK